MSSEFRSKLLGCFNLNSPWAYSVKPSLLFSVFDFFLFFFFFFFSKDPFFGIIRDIVISQQLYIKCLCWGQSRADIIYFIFSILWVYEGPYILSENKNFSQRCGAWGGVEKSCIFLANWQSGTLYAGKQYGRHKYSLLFKTGGKIPSPLFNCCSYIRWMDTTQRQSPLSWKCLPVFSKGDYSNRQ